MGALLKPGLVLTARHCFVQGDEFSKKPSAPLGQEIFSNAQITGLNIQGTQWTEPIVAVKFDPFDDRALKKYSSAEKSLKYRRENFPYTLDFVVVEIKAKEDQNLEHMRLATFEHISNIQPRQRLLLGAFFEEEESSENASLFVDDMRSCLVRKINPRDGYLHHHCQSLPGVSGSPLFVFDSTDNLFIVGVHVSQAGTLKPSRIPTTGNEAVIVFNNIIQGLLN
ncbi:MAG: hypothetical protein NPIRA05_08380 [Nitrospirales bacterium]|nr:MAG: hypothetical protein NPIRA05_08380 [Nitrospirales bacterium]